MDVNPNDLVFNIIRYMLNQFKYLKNFMKVLKPLIKIIKINYKILINSLIRFLNFLKNLK